MELVSSLVPFMVFAGLRLDAGLHKLNVARPAYII